MFESIIEQGQRLLAGLGAGDEGSSLPAILSAAGVLLLTVWAMGSLRRRLRRQAEHASPAAPRSASARAGVAGARAAAGSSRTARLEIERFMVDAEELTRRLAATLDSKADRVETLLDRLESRLAELEAHADAPDASQRDASQRRNHAQRRRTPVRAVSVPVGELEPGAPGDPLRDEVLRLADEGLPPVEIARRLSEQIGKVELILALREA